jgi:hypothetical protein
VVKGILIVTRLDTTSGKWVMTCHCGKEVTRATRSILRMKDNASCGAWRCKRMGRGARKERLT